MGFIVVMMYGYTWLHLTEPKRLQYSGSLKILAQNTGSEYSLGILARNTPSPLTLTWHHHPPKLSPPPSLLEPALPFSAYNYPILNPRSIDSPLTFHDYC